MKTKTIQMNMEITKADTIDNKENYTEDEEATIDTEIINVEEIEYMPVIKKIKYITKQRICALMTLLAFIINIFSPYGLLLQSTYAVSEQTPQPGEPYYKLSITPVDGTVDYDDWDDATNYYYYDFDPDTDTIETYSGTRLITMTLTINGCNTVNAGTIYFKYDSSKLIPASEVNKGTNKKPIWVIEEAETYEDFAETGWGLPVIELLDRNISTIGVEGGVKPGGDKYIADGELVATFTFKLAEGITLEDLTEDVMALNTTYSSIYPTGLKIPYFKDGVSVFVNQPYYLLYEGFASSNKKSVTGITLNSNMSKTKYYTGENIDFTGAKITIEYDDDSSDVITDISKAVKDGLITIDSTKASTSKKVVVTAEGKTCDLNYNIATGITVAKNPTKMTYDHDDAINFTGGTINVIYDNGDTVSLDMSAGITSKLLTVDKTKADVNDKTVTFTYIDGKSQDSINLTVNDPIVNIAVTTNPSTTTYDHNDTINFTGGTIEATKKSGAKISGISMTDPKVSVSSKTADINSCTTTWSNGDLTAGNQDITVTYEGKSDKFSIVVNDTISSITVKTHPTAKNKYGTEGNSLNLTGAQLEVTTSSNNKFTTNINVGMLNLTGYNKQTLTTQNLPVTYGGLTTSTGNGVNIKLKDYIIGITVTAPNDLTANYNTELDLSNVTYVKNYAGGTTSSSQPVTKSMILGYNKTPLASTFNSNHESPETITVTLNTPEDADVDTIPVSDTFNIKVKDTVTGITIATRPNKTTYNYGETFSATGGRVQLSYASGATASSSVSMLDTNVKITETDDSPINMSPSASSFTNGRATKTLKVTYTDPNTSQKYSANLQNVFVNDVLDTIQIGTQPKKTFDHGDTFSVGSGTLELTYKSGNTDTIDLDDGTTIRETVAGTSVNMSPAATAYTDNSLTKNLTVSYTEGQVTKTTNYDITIKNPIDRITIGTSPKTNYNLNDPKDVTGTITVTRKAGNTSTVNITDSMVTGLDTSVAGTNKEATVTYTEDGVTKTTKYNYNVVDNITGVTITPPTKTKYNHGNPLDLTGGKIKIDYASGSSDDNIPITSDMITEANGSTANTLPSISDYGTTHKYDKTLKITYTAPDGTEHTKDYPITIINDVKSITVNSTTHKTNYNVKENLDVTNLTISVHRAIGNDETKSVTAGMVSGFSSTTENTSLPLTVSYTENDITKTTNYTVSVRDAVTSIAIKDTPKTNYKYNDSLDVSTGTLSVTKGSGTTTVSMTSSMVTELDGTPFDSSNLTPRNLLVTYGGQTAQYPITVKDYVTGIRVHPNNITGDYGAELGTLIDDNLIKYVVTYAKVGDQTPENLTEAMVVGYNKTSTTTQNLKVKYTDNDTNSFTIGTEFKADLTIELEDKITGITLTTLPTNRVYGYNDTGVDLTGGELTVSWQSGKPDTVTLPSSDVTVTETDGTPLNLKNVTFGADNTATKTVQVNYKGQKTIYTVAVVNKVTGIKMKDTPKTKYNVGESLDITTDNGTTPGTIEVTREYGPKETVNLTSRMVTGFSSTVENTALSLTVTYTENNITKTTAYTVSVKDSVNSIAIKDTPKTNYKYNEPLDVSTGTLDVTKGSGTTNIPMNNSMVTELDGSPFDSSNLTPRELLVTYGGQTDKYSITVKDYVTGIRVQPNSITGEYEAELGTLIDDNLIKYVVTYAKVGDQTPEDLTEAMVQGYNKTSTTTQNLKVKYTDNDTNSFTKGKEFETDLTIELEDKITGIALTILPTKDKYGYNDASVDLTGGELTVTWQSGKPDTVTLPSTDVTVTETDGTPLNLKNVTFGADNTATKTVQVNYKGQKTIYTVTVINKVTGIAMKDTPKTNYNVGESLDITTDNGTTPGTIEVTREYGPKETIDLTPSMVTGFGSVTENTALPLTVTYTENGITETTNYTVSVRDSVTSIAIKDMPKIKYKYNEPLDVSTGTLDVTKGSGTTNIPMNNSMVTELDGSPFDSTNLTARKLLVTYGGQTTKYDITIEDYIDRIEIKQPDKLIYDLDETSIDLTGGTVTVVMASGRTTTPVDMSNPNVTISGFNTSSEGAKVITVEYEGKKATFGITVVDSLKGIVIATLPDKKVYKYGESLDLTGGTIEIEKGSGAKEIIPMKSSMVSGYNPKQLGNQTLIVTYGKYTQEFIVRVDDYISHLMVTPPEKVEYEYGENLNLKGGKVSIITASGAVEESAEMTASMVSGYNKTAEGTQNIKVEYKDLQGDFNVNVVDKIKAISMNNYPNKVNYKYNENLDLTGATINVVKSSGIYKVTVTYDMISGFNGKNPGTQVITVTYAGFTTNFTVNVAEQEKPQKPNKPTVSKPVEKPVVQEPIVEEPIIEEPVTPIEPPVIVEPEPEPEPEEKPTIVLGEKDEKDDDDFIKILAIGMCGLGLLVLIILLASRRNVEIYVYEDGEFVLAGKEKIKKNEPYVDVDEYLDGNTYDNQVIVCLNKTISKKLDEKSIRIKHRGATAKYKVKYNYEDYEIVLN